MSEATMCDPKAKVCAYGEYSECLLTCHPMLTIPGEENIRFSQWMTEKIMKDEKVSTITVKSENYSCKYSQEIQSVHFGGSHQQASLHTGVLYTAGGQAPHTFCSISPSRRHDPVAIWAHLDPILKVVRERHPQVSILHFFSDGPATQYRQKGNFFYLSTEPYKYGFKEITWNFFEASHGKGAPDGVGGVLKRSADRIVAHGGDIPDAQSLYDKLKSLDTSVELFFVPERDIESKTQVPAIAAVKGTLRIHQAISLTPGQMKYRDISCLCKREEGVLDCPCFNLQEVTLADVPVSSDESPASGKAPDNPRRPAMIEVKHIGEWCVVNYDNEAYPGFIMDAEGHSVKVKCMHRNGINKFHWPSPREDICWYYDWHILCLIPEPQALNKRSVQIEASAWKYVEEQLQK
ncbi:Enolase [Dissostichus eleginoides]|uniref:Enolase n=1 Tax=Dissostichus eleginoides TaxID=100907 RepID=A0AAD9B9J1_DISEL|nr:Enolase [Dissostichus eleginoides]